MRWTSRLQHGADGVEPEPAAHCVDGVAGGVAGPGLGLCILVGDEVAAEKLARLQPVVERECVEQRGREDESEACESVRRNSGRRRSQGAPGRSLARGLTGLFGGLRHLYKCSDS